MTSKTNRCFVYGTLREHEGGQYKPATHVIYGFKMFNYYDRFPYITHADSGSAVVGQVLHISDDELQRLDAYEGVSRGLYLRDQVEVFDKETKHSDGWAHVYVAGNIAPMEIASGDWSHV